MPISPSPITDRVVIFSGMVLVLILGLVYLLHGDFLASNTPDRYLSSITIGGTPLKVYVSDTEAERNQGLSGYTALPFTQGMLFVFPEDGIYNIWMKDMRFPIDIIWITADNVVADIDTNVPPESFPKTYKPSVPVRYIVETSASFVEQYNIHIGDKVEL